MLEIVSPEKYPLGDNARKYFNEVGGTIGRAPDCFWAIVDGSRILSGHHAHISFARGQYVLTDTSTNGVFVNDSAVPLGYDKSCVIQEGDTLTMGAFEMRAWISQTSISGEHTEIFPSPSSHSVASPFDLNSLCEDPFSANFPEQKNSQDISCRKNFCPEDKCLEDSCPEDNWHNKNIDVTSTRSEEQIRSLHSVLSAAGLSLEDYEVYGESLLHAIGTVFKESVTGLQKLLRSRTALKNEFRLSMTMINVDENNPLKLTSSYQQALRVALEEKQGYLSLDHAIVEGFQDIQDHQLAVMAGMKAGFDYMMKRLDPEALDNRNLKSRKKLFFSIGRKSRCWDSYQRLYSDLVDDEDVFRSLFSDSFERAYNQHMEKVKLSEAK